jgi:uncharacterized protein YndB with AHSA1/START domain
VKLALELLGDFMLDLLTLVLAVIGLGAVAFLVYVALLPGDFRIARTAEVAAPADRIFTLINDLHQFNRWNPFAKADPTSEISYSGPAQGVGAAFAWAGRKSGSGQMTIATSVPSSLVTMQLDFTKPFTAHNRAEFSVVPRGGVCHVTWAMTGRRPYSHKLMGALFNMDRMVGDEFSKGLANLKSLAETTA